MKYADRQFAKPVSCKGTPSDLISDAFVIASGWTNWQNGLYDMRDVRVPSSCT